jgi:hypothetical protein
LGIDRGFAIEGKAHGHESSGGYPLGLIFLGFGITIEIVLFLVYGKRVLKQSRNFEDPETRQGDSPNIPVSSEDRQVEGQLCHGKLVLLATSSNKWRSTSCMRLKCFENVSSGGGH